jgi:putative peptidoglycan lipid II flippase
VKRSLSRVAGIVGLATLLSKSVGLFRAVYVASVFGVGSVVDAFNYAYLLPGFLLILIGGISGPFHTALLSVLAKRDAAAAGRLISTLSTLVTLWLIPVAIALAVFAPFWIDLIAPGLSPEVRAIAIPQLQLMAPLAILAGWIGISLGVLNAIDLYWLPSISPICSSLAVMGAIALATTQFPQWQGYGLAIGTIVGAVGQWALQLWAQRRAGLGGLRPNWNFKTEGVSEVLQIMAPATLSSGMMQINIYVDLLFASYIPHAAAALGYAELLAYAPRGILASLLLVPLLPEFARLSGPEHREALVGRIRQGLVLAALTTLPLSALMGVLAPLIIQLVYQRQAFDGAASELVTSVFVVYCVGLFPSLWREILVRVFYGLGDGQTPMRISVVNILLNVGLDYALVKFAGAPGLVLATVGVNVVAIAMLSVVLHRRLGGLPWREWSVPLGQVFVSSLVSGAVAAGIRWGWEWMGERSGELGFLAGFWGQLAEVMVAGSLGLAIGLLFLWHWRLSNFLMPRAMKKPPQP